MSIRPGLLDSKVEFQVLNPDAKATKDRYNNYTSTVSGEDVWKWESRWVHVRSLEREDRESAAALVPEGFFSFVIDRTKWFQANVNIGTVFKWDGDEYTVTAITNNFRSLTATVSGSPRVESEE